MSIIYPNGSAEITIPAGQKIYVSSSSSVDIYQRIVTSNHPVVWDFLITTTGGTAYTSAAFADGAVLRIDAGADVVDYEVGASPPAAVAGNFTTIQAATTIGVGAATPSTTGAGITFPATQSASSNANTLDDYEEGTFTAVVSDASTGGNTVTPTQVSTYTKIGRKVSFICTLLNINTSGLTAGNQVFVQSLPFTMSSGANSRSTLSVGSGSVTLTSGNISGQILHNSSVINMFNPSGTVYGTSLLVSNLASGTADLYISGEYTA